MAHPFTKLFDVALKKSTDERNVVLETAEKLLERGYSPTEVGDVLVALQKSLIDEKMASIVADALEELAEELDSDD